jgi:hypothetical protein
MIRRFLLVLFAPALLHAAPVEFARDILPILSDNCYKCHGPDEGGRKADLRLDTKEGIYRTKDDVTVVVPGKIAESDLITRIFSTDPDEVMPSPKSNRTLSDEQKQLLKRWVEEGAKWGRHWAFERMRHSPMLIHGNPIDTLVAMRLNEEGLVFSPLADKERLIRRVTFDLTGLPPTLAEIDAFLGDASPQAYESVVDRLLASPHYGERLAGDWLDVARFADTGGYQADRPRAMWAYRDWVIKAFNENLPWDKFATWQLAGDLLPNATKEQRLATAFNRLHSQTEEGGVVGEEFRVAYVVDRVDTFGTAFLGLTFECSRCHDHKFDPITQKDFYSLFAMFQNIDESGQTTYFTDAMPVPTLLLSTDEQDAKLAQLNAQIAEKEKALAALREPARPAFAEWLKSRASGPVDVAGEVAAFDFETIEKGKIANAIDAAKPGNAVEGPQLVAGRVGQCAELTGENGFTFPNLGHFTRADAFSFAIAVQPAAPAPQAVVFHHSKAPVDAGNRGYELLLEDGHVAFGLHHMWPGNSLKVRTRAALPAGAWARIAVTYDGSSRAAGLRIYLDGAPAELEIIRDGLWKDITYEGGEPDLAIGYRFRDAGFKGGRVDDFRIFNRELTGPEVAQLAGKPDEARLFDTFFATLHEPAKQALAALHAARDEQRKFINPIPESMAMRELPQPKPAFVLKRGAYDMHGEEVHPDTPHALPPLPAGAPRNRLGLAQWLLDPENPLTARVAVNRLWQMMFGRGLVETSDNFGQQGAWPTHRELLDWLARDFVASGWDVKAALKQIAMSVTYRQTSRAPPELLARDPENKLLARGPARRLTAEMLRDQALADSGLLAENVGGPSVKPYQPAGLWNIAMGNPAYDQSHGADLHRRSLYTFWKRTVPPPTMMTFDAADRSYCTVRRQSTTTPLQALALLNDVQIVEAARHIAERAIKATSTPADRAAWTFRTITGRKPTDQEATVIAKLMDEQHTLFAANPEAATKLLTFGETKSDPALDAPTLAAQTVLAQTLLNFDEALMRR